MARLEQGWIQGQEGTVSAALAQAAAAHPDRVFLDFSGETFTYGDVERRSVELARGLGALGVGAGDRVAAVLDNNVDAVATWSAVNRLAAACVPVNTAYKGEFLRHQIADSGARVVIAESDYSERVLSVADGLPDVGVLLHRGEGPPQRPAGWRVEPLAAHRLDGGDAVPVISRPDDLASLIYTAGTTGPSKGCMISQGYMMNIARLVLRITGRRADEVSWTPLPLFHVNGISSVLSTMALGSTLAISTRFSVSGFWADIERTDARIVNLLGSMIPLIARMDENDAMRRCKGQIRVLLGVPFTPELEQIWRDRFGVESVGSPGYGLTEAGGMVTTPVGQGRPGTSGRCADDFDVRIFDDADHELPPGEVGEIVCRPLQPQVMFSGYWRRPDATAAATRSLWFHTGDLGKVDDEGWLTFVDRKKDYLRRGGENISSFEMEAAFLQRPDIVEVAVHAVVSQTSEDDVKVTAVLRPEATVNEAELCQWAIDHLPYFAVPRYIEFRGELPRNPTGKVLKYELREDGCTPTTWDREAAGVTFQKR